MVLAKSLNPIPSRTRPLNSSAPMVLWLKPWESRSLPGLPKTKQFLFTCHDQTERRLLREAVFLFLGQITRRLLRMSETDSGRRRHCYAVRAGALLRSTPIPPLRERAVAHRICVVMPIIGLSRFKNSAPGARCRDRRSPNSELLVIIRPRFGISFRREFTSRSVEFP